jgi:hypothetical protein
LGLDIVIRGSINTGLNIIVFTITDYPPDIDSLLLNLQQNRPYYTVLILYICIVRRSKVSRFAGRLELGTTRCAVLLEHPKTPVERNA